MRGFGNVRKRATAVVDLNNMAVAKESFVRASGTQSQIDEVKDEIEAVAGELAPLKSTLAQKKVGLQTAYDWMYGKNKLCKNTVIKTD
jgi:hypothetical protein